MVPLAHPDPSKAVSLLHLMIFGPLCARSSTKETLKNRSNSKTIADCGRFTGAQLRWPTIEKEAFAIVESAKRLEYLLLRPGGFHLFTDHRNLVYMFNPTATDGAMQRYQADKLQRWAMTMTSYRYVIEHVRGSDNVWVDMLSRWGNTEHCASAAVAAVKQVVVVPPISPLENGDFDFPTLDEIRDAQNDQESKPDIVSWSEERSCFLVDKDRVWIPASDSNIRQRICVVDIVATEESARQQRQLGRGAGGLTWPKMWLTTRDGRVPRPYGPALHATKPNEVLHFDYLTLPEDEDTHNKYVLVLKDDLSGYVELFPTTGPDAASCAVSLLSWFYRYGIVKQWVADQGTHFKNDVIAHLAKEIGANHHFITAYCPWANGTVEVVNRMLLKCMRAVLSERKMPPSKWEPILGIVQAALNHQPSDRLGGRAPITAFTGLPAMTPLAAIFPMTK
ncbi:Hypothetical protein PHPALM_20207 [Phytophthora palmivora]|uniref:Integrase catalytic domain-containing protein n=1 Tax=Phytophthora palmivora TaxID=4796 RepID=A0A2P4XFH1_9STRA|nr:Hypothetical protein PHPALM_20207 [Phytophthora palmivora]